MPWNIAEISRGHSLVGMFFLGGIEFRHILDMKIELAKEE